MSTRKNKNELNFQQRKFVNAYIDTGNITSAAISAGYSINSAASQGSRLFKDVKIKRAIEKREKELELASLITKDFIQAEYLRLYQEEAQSVNEKKLLLDALGDTIGVRKQHHVLETKDNDLSALSDEELERHLKRVQDVQLTLDNSNKENKE